MIVWGEKAMLDDGSFFEVRRALAAETSETHFTMF